MRRRLLIFGAAALIGTFLVAIFFFRPAASPRVLPVPNGYDELIHAANLLTPETGDLSTLPLADARVFLRTNAQTIDLLKSALRMECAVSTRPTVNNPQSTKNLVSTKRAAQCFVVAGKVAEADGHPYLAAGSYLNAIRVGAFGMKDGVLIDRLVATACEVMGTRPLSNVVEKLSARECREVIEALEEIDQKREPLEKTWRNEREFIRQESRSITHQFAVLFSFRSRQRVLDASQLKVETAILHERELMMALAARAFELEKGKPPERMEQLVPELLKTIPQDPTTKSNLPLKAFPLQKRD